MASKASIRPTKGHPSSNKHKDKGFVRNRDPKPPLSVPERLQRLFTSLCAQVDGGHFNNAIKTCDKILRLKSDDADAIQTKLFLLLQTEQYGAALSLIGQNNEDSRHAFERAYSFYRMQREEEARQVLTVVKEEMDEDDRGVMHLEAQLRYREGSYREAVELYNQLLDTIEPQSEEHSDILINLQASQKHLDFIETGFLHALDTLPTSITTTIETNPPPTQPSIQLISTLAKASASVEPVKVAEKKVRKSRVPAGVIPGVTPAPDPERWLKKSERSTFNQGRRKKGPGGGGATQGSATVDAVGPATSGSSSHGTKSGGKGKKRK